MSEETPRVDSRITKVEQQLSSLASTVGELSETFKNNAAVTSKLLRELAGKVSDSRVISWPMVTVLLVGLGMACGLLAAVLKPINASVLHVALHGEQNRAEFKNHLIHLDEVLQREMKLENEKLELRIINVVDKLEYIKDRADVFMSDRWTKTDHQNYINGLP